MTAGFPNLLYIGADKAGSTSIAAILADHPHVHVSPAKDTYYFTTEFHRGAGWYRRQFSPQPHHRIVAEICHDYLYDALAPTRIADELGTDVTLLVCLRDPVDRAVSSWLHHRKHGSRVAFAEAVSAFPDIVEHGDYGTHLSRWYAVFPPERIIVALFDELEADPVAFARALYRRLGLSAHEVSDGAVAPRRTASEPRSSAVAAAVKRAAVGVRRLGRPALVGRIKSSGLVQRFLYRPIHERPQLDPATAASLRERFALEVKLASALTGIDLFRSWPLYREAPDSSVTEAVDA